MSQSDNNNNDSASITFSTNVPVSVIREFFDGLAKVEAAKQQSSRKSSSFLDSLYDILTILGPTAVSYFSSIKQNSSDDVNLHTQCSLTSPDERRQNKSNEHCESNIAANDFRDTVSDDQFQNINNFFDKIFDDTVDETGDDTSGETGDKIGDDTAASDLLDETNLDDVLKYIGFGGININFDRSVANELLKCVKSEIKNKNLDISNVESDIAAIFPRVMASGFSKNTVIAEFGDLIDKCWKSTEESKQNFTHTCIPLLDKCLSSCPLFKENNNIISMFSGLSGLFDKKNQ